MDMTSPKRSLAAPVVVTLLVATLALLLLAPEASAHRQGLREGYERVLYDCSHDWGWEAGYPLTRGHELVTLDIDERMEGGDALVLFEINMVKAQASGYGTSYDMEEELRFETPRATVTTRLESTTETGPMTFVAGEMPAYLGPRKFGLTSGGVEDEALLAWDIGYTYEQLQIQNGESLSGFEVVSYHEPTLGGSVVPADLLAGGYWDGGDFVEGCRRAPDNDPLRDDTFYEAGLYVVEASDWQLPGAPNTPPVAGFELTPTTPEVDAEVVFTDTSVDEDGTIVSWSWNFGDGASSTDEDPRHTYAAAGSYTVRLTVTDDAGGTATTTRTLSLQDPGNGNGSEPQPAANQAPSASFILEPTHPVAGEAVTLTDASFDPDGALVSWTWDLDGAPASGRTVEQTWTEPGSYTVSLSVTDDDGATSSSSRTIQVAAPGSSSGAGLLADFEVRPTAPKTLEELEFVDVSDTGDARILSRAWDLGDGTSTGGQTILHTYRASGTFTVKLTLTAEDGETAQVSKQVKVANRPPEPSFTYSPERPEAGQLVRFEDTSVDEDGRIVARNWFVAGKAGHEAAMEVRFPEAGTHEVVLTVTDSQGEARTIHVEVPVAPSSDGAGAAGEDSPGPGALLGVGVLAAAFAAR
ncbi:MAG: PKD domain-containing protein, partial [Thermoplasmatota archaeon]